MQEIKININGFEFVGVSGEIIVDVAKRNNIDIPTLCHDGRVKPYGSCGICVVEAEGNPRLIRACSTEISNGMVIKTDTERIRGARQIALELLVSDHTGDCRPPCSLNCPGDTDCQGYVGLIANGEYLEATKLIKDKIPFPSSIGRVCPHPCEEKCRRHLVEEPISICRLKSFATDIDLESESPYSPECKEYISKRVTIIGGGPGGLSAAYFLIQNGVDVTVLDAMPKMGGMLRYGIPEYRLPKKIVDAEIDILVKMGVKFVNNVKVGTDIMFQHIIDTNDAVINAIGAWKSMALGCKGEDLQGVIGGIDFLRKVSLGHTGDLKLSGKRVAVVGGGNTAMDALRTAVRLGAEKVYNIYRRTRNEMPAEEIEIVEAEEEGVIFKFLNNPIEIIGDSSVSGIKLQKMMLGEPDKSGRRSPVPKEGETEDLPVDIVIIAIGQATESSGFDILEKTRRGTILADEKTFKTNIEKVFAIGDATNKGADIAISAIGEGRKAAYVILSYLQGEIIPYKKPFIVERDDITAADLKDYVKTPRRNIKAIEPKIRKNNFFEVAIGYTEEEAKSEAARCLECGCSDYYECKLLKYSNEYDIKPARLKGAMHKRGVSKSHPYINITPDKCILCGLCVRVCDEVMGRTALGLVNRGFDAAVKPSFSRPLNESECISCGQCVNLCPTGALAEKLCIDKPVPVKEVETATTCSFCSVGCKTLLTSKGGKILRSLPIGDDGILCVKGRFGFNAYYSENSIKKYYIRKNQKLSVVTENEAFQYSAKMINSIAMNYGSDSVAVSVSDKYTNEDIFAIKHFAQKCIGTKNIVSFNSADSGLEEVFGNASSPNTFDEMLNTNLIILFGSNIMKDHTIAYVKLRRAVENGAKLIVINPFDSSADEIAYKKFVPENNISFLKQIAKAVVAKVTPNAEDFENYKMFADGLDTEASGDAAFIADAYVSAKKAMFVFDEKVLTKEAQAYIASIAAISKHIGKAREGIVVLKQNNNSQGLYDMGIRYDKIENKIKNKNVRALIIFGEDCPYFDLSKLDLVIQIDNSFSQTSEFAHVIIPAPTPLSYNGTFTGSDRKVRKVNGLGCGEGYIKILCRFAKEFEVKSDISDISTVRKLIGEQISDYRRFSDLITDNDAVSVPTGKSPVLYEKSFSTPSGKARLFDVGYGKLFNAEVINTNYNYTKFMISLEKNGLVRE